jgi:hypothetical protein
VRARRFVLADVGGIFWQVKGAGAWQAEAVEDLQRQQRRRG